MNNSNNLKRVEANLPPGFRFHPRDEELICDYLMNKIAGFTTTNNPEMMVVDLNKCEPWDIPETACVGGKDWYFYSQRDRKYASGLRRNRATVCGYWKATGKDREVHSLRRKGMSDEEVVVVVGMRKTLVFYKGRAPKGNKTDWVMHEFRLHPSSSSSSSSSKEDDQEKDWVVCRVFHKKKLLEEEDEANYKRSVSCFDHQYHHHYYLTSNTKTMDQQQQQQHQHNDDDDDSILYNFQAQADEEQEQATAQLLQVPCFSTFTGDGGGGGGPMNINYYTDNIIPHDDEMMNSFFNTDPLLSHDLPTIWNYSSHFN